MARPAALFATLGCAALLLSQPLACTDSDNDNPGVLDGGRALTRKPCAAEGQCCVCFSAPDGGTDGGSTEPETQLTLFDSDSANGRLVFFNVRNEAVARSPKPWSQWNTSQGGMGSGMRGTVNSMASSSSKDKFVLCKSGPSQLSVYKPAFENGDNEGDYTIGTGVETLGPCVLGADDVSVFVASPTTNSVYQINADTKAETKALTATDAAGLSQPSALALGPAGLCVGSTSMAQNGVYFFNPSPFAFNTRLTLVDGTSTGVAAGPCVATAQGCYCAAQAGVPGPGLWLLRPGQPSKRVADLPAGATQLALSARGDKLFAAVGPALHAFWVKGRPESLSPMQVLTLDGPIHTLAASNEGRWLFASTPSTSTVRRIDLLDLAVDRTYTSFGATTAMSAR